MRRALGIVAVLGAVAGGAALAGAGGDEGAKPTYEIVLDNSFGLTKGVDFRVTGVKVGSVEGLDLEPRTARAIARVSLQDDRFGGLRRDARCTVQPQSLIGEYFLDCEPGKGAELPAGGRIPVEQTSGTVPPDLVQSTLRLPYRQRLGILLSELGAGVAARGGDVSAAISRAIPALRETDRVLAILADERETLQGLIRDADVVVGDLADGREQVGRFVSASRDAAQASAERREQLRGTIARLPDFERGLRPVLEDLGEVARRQTPALADLRAAAPSLTTLLQRLGPFSDATVEAVDTLGDASRTGLRTVGPARTTVRRLRDLAVEGLEPARNLRIMGQHLDDRRFAIEKNPRSPGGEGFTGLEAFLQYPYVQAQAINLFDARGYTLKLNALANDCSAYANARTRAANPARTALCNSDLGDGAPEPAPAAARTRTEDAPSARREPSPAAAPPATQPQPQPSAPAPQPTTSVPQTTPQPQPQRPGALPQEIRIPGLPPIKLPGILGGGREEPQRPVSPQTSSGLLDLLLGGGS